MEQVVLVNCALAAQRAGGCGGRGLAPTAFKMPPLPGLNSHKLFDESSLLHSGCHTCFLTPINPDSSVLSPGRGGIFVAVGYVDSTCVRAFCAARN